MGTDKVISGKLRVDYGQKLSTLDDYRQALEKVKNTKDLIYNNRRVVDEAKGYSYNRDGASELLRLYQNEIAELNAKIRNYGKGK